MVAGAVIQAGARDANQKDKRLTHHQAHHLFHLRSVAVTLALAFGFDIGVGFGFDIGVGKCLPRIKVALSYNGTTSVSPIWSIALTLALPL